MKKSILVLVILIIAIGGGYLIWDYFKNSPVDTGLSPEQHRAERVLGNGPVEINDLHLAAKEDIYFTDKKGELKVDDGIIKYEIVDVLQPFNLDAKEEDEWPYLLRADYPDGLSLAYLVITRQKGDRFIAVDQVTVGDPQYIDDIHSYEKREVIVEALIGEDNKERIFLAYKLENDKIVPDKNNYDLENYKPGDEEIVDVDVIPEPADDTDTNDNTANENANTPSDDDTNDNSDDDDTPANTNSGGGGTSGSGNIALTFDDGPGVHTPEILDVLSSKGIQATFFMIGENVGNYPDYVSRVVNEGHEVGNHTWDHPEMTKLSYDAQVDELQKTLDVIHGVVPGINIPFFRPPYMEYDDNTTKAANSLGMSVELWNVDTRDWSGLPADQIRSGAVGPATAGSIILMHDGVANSGQTAQALPGIIDDLEGEEYTLVTLSQL